MSERNEQNRFTVYKEKIKSMSKSKLTIHFLVSISAVLLLVAVIVLIVFISRIQNNYLEYTDSLFEGTMISSPDGIDHSNLLQLYPDKGPEALSWLLTANDKIGGPLYYLCIVCGLLMIPAMIYTIVFHLVYLFPKKSAEEKKLKKENKKHTEQVNLKGVK